MRKVSKRELLKITLASGAAALPVAGHLAVSAGSWEEKPRRLPNAPVGPRHAIIFVGTPDLRFIRKMDAELGANLKGTMRAMKIGGRLAAAYSAAVAGKRILDRMGGRITRRHLAGALVGASAAGMGSGMVTALGAAGEPTVVNYDLHEALARNGYVIHVASTVDEFRAAVERARRDGAENGRTIIAITAHGELKNNHSQFTDELKKSQNRLTEERHNLRDVQLYSLLDRIPGIKAVFINSCFAAGFSRTIATHPNRREYYVAASSKDNPSATNEPFYKSLAITLDQPAGTSVNEEFSRVNAEEAAGYVPTVPEAKKYQYTIHNGCEFRL